MKLRMSRIVEVERVDRRVDAGGGLVGRLGHESGHVLERQPDRVERLDDPVVQVAPDPVPLLDHGESAGLGVQPGVVDRDPGVQREQLDEARSSSRTPPRRACRSGRGCRPTSRGP